LITGTTLPSLLQWTCVRYEGMLH